MFFQVNSFPPIASLSPALGRSVASSLICSLKIASEPVSPSARAIGASMSQWRMYPSESGCSTSAAPRFESNRQDNPTIKSFFILLVRVSLFHRHCHAVLRWSLQSVEIRQDVLDFLLLQQHAERRHRRNREALESFGKFGVWIHQTF